MRYEKYLIAEAKVGDWLVQKRRDATVYAMVLEVLKNGASKVLMFDDSYGVAKMGSTKGWFPAPESIKRDSVPKDVLSKMAKKLAKTKYSGLNI